LGIIPVLGDLISSKDMSDDIKHEAILLCIGLLLGGNVEVQDTFHKFLLLDEHNLFMINLN
jgi:hypothetical protein